MMKRIAEVRLLDIVCSCEVPTRFQPHHNIVLGRKIFSRKSLRIMKAESFSFPAASNRV
jgi:hypothetical protein